MTKINLSGYVCMICENSTKAYKDGVGYYLQRIAKNGLQQGIYKAYNNIPLLVPINNKLVEVANTKDNSLHLVEDNIGIFATAHINTDNEYLIKRVADKSIQDWQMEVEPYRTYWDKDKDTGMQVFVIDGYIVKDIKIILYPSEPKLRSSLKVSFNY